MRNNIIMMICATALLGSCHIYRAYDRPEEIRTDSLYRGMEADTVPEDSLLFGNQPWREVFTDSKLVRLIERGLAKNFDLEVARLNVEAAKASLLGARLAYAPSFMLTPQGTLSSFDKQPVTKTYQLPVSASWEIDLFGKTLNNKRAAQASLKQTEAYRQGVQIQVIGGIANTYYTLMMLDKQLDVSKQQPSQPASSSQKPDHSLALKVADEIVRIKTNLMRMDTSVKGHKQLSKAVERIEANFLANGYEIVDMLGKPYYEGMKVAASFVDDETLPKGTQKITRVIKPQINYNNVMIQAAQIEVSQNI